MSPNVEVTVLTPEQLAQRVADRRRQVRAEVRALHQITRLLHPFDPVTVKRMLRYLVERHGA